MWWRKPLGNRIKSRNLLTVADLKRTARGGRRPLQIEPLEERTLLSLSTPIIDADDPGGNGTDNGLADEFLLVRNGADVEVWIDGNFSQSVPFAPLQSITVNGSGDDDTLIVDLSGGEVIPPGGIDFDGAGEDTTGDTMEVIGGGNAATYMPDAAIPGDGTVVVVGGGGLARLFAVPDDSPQAIVELDPASGVEINRFAAPEPVSAGSDGLAFDGTSLFFINGDGTDTLYELDPDTGAVSDADVITTGSGDYDGLATLGGNVYILDYGLHDIIEFDPVSDTVTNVLDVDGLNPGVHLRGGLAGITGPNALIATDFYSDVQEIDPATGLVGASFTPPGGGDYYGVGVVGGEIYLGHGFFSTDIDVYSRAGAFQRSIGLPYSVSALGADDVGLGTITFTGLEPVVMSNLATLTLITPGDADFVTVDNPYPGVSVVTGTSDAVPFESLTFWDVTTFTLDAAINTAGGGDTIIFNPALAGLGGVGASVFEAEPNDTSGLADVITPGVEIGVGAVSPPGDTDYWVGLTNSFGVDPNPGDLVFAYVDTQHSTTSPDSFLTVYDSMGGVIEMDDNDGPGYSSVIAGATLGLPGPVFFQVDEWAFSDISQYELYTEIVDPADSAPEFEPVPYFNDTPGTATPITATMMTGTVAPGSGDVDYFSFFANVGDRIVLMVDEDPERNGATDLWPVEIIDVDGVTTLATGDGQFPPSDAEAAGAVATAPNTGWYYVSVGDGGFSVDPTGTYRFVLQVFNGGRPLTNVNVDTGTGDDDLEVNLPYTLPGGGAFTWDAGGGLTDQDDLTVNTATGSVDDVIEVRAGMVHALAEQPISLVTSDFGQGDRIYLHTGGGDDLTEVFLSTAPILPHVGVYGGSLNLYSEPGTNQALDFYVGGGPGWGDLIDWSTGQFITAMTVTGNVAFHGQDSAGDTDVLTVHGLNMDETVTVGPDAIFQGQVQIDANAVKFQDISSLTVETGDEASSDDITVTPLDIPVHIDGEDPDFTALPGGDKLTVDVTGIPVTDFATMTTGPGAGMVQVNSLGPITYADIERLDATGGLMDLYVNAYADPGSDNVANDGQADTFKLILNGAFLEVYVNGDLVQAVEVAAVNSILVDGSSDQDTFTVDNSGGLIVLPVGIVVDGEGVGYNPPGTIDALVIEGDPGIEIRRETYVSGPSVPNLPPVFGPLGPDAGLIILDPDDVPGAGYPFFQGIDGDEQVILFDDLSPIYDSTPAVQLDIALTPGGDTVNVVDGPGFGGFVTTEVNDGGTAAFERIEFANKQVVTVNGLDGSDTITVNNPNAADGLVRLEVYGNELTDGLLNLDDGLSDQFHIEATDAGVPVEAYGQGGNDVFDVENLADNVDEILGDVTVDGGAGDDDLVVDDTGSAGGSETVTLTDTTIDGITAGGGGGGLVTYLSLGAGTVTVSSNGAGHLYSVESTAAGLAETELNTGGGDDEITIRELLAAIANGVVSPIDLNAQGGVDDRLRIYDGDDPAANTFHMNATEIGGGAFTDPVEPGGIFGSEGILYYDGDLEGLLVIGPNNAGLANTYNIDGTGVGLTSGAGLAEIEDGQGNGVFNIQADQLAAPADHNFGGRAGTDTFNVHLAAGAVVTGNSVVINGDLPDPGGFPARDVVNVIDAGGARNTTITYPTVVNQLVEVQIDAGTLLELRAVERVDYLGDAANDDDVTVVGTAGDDDLTVAPQSLNSALVFIDGNPWDGPGDGDFFDAVPGIAGGGSDPDLFLDGVSADLDPGVGVDSGLNIDGGGMTDGDQLYVYGMSENDLEDAARNVVIPGVGAGNAYDAIRMSDGQVSIVNNAAGQLLPVDIVTASFVQAPGHEGVPGLVVNSGFEADPNPGPGTPPLVGLADDVTALLSNFFALHLNGGDPVPALAPQGDRLEVSTPAEVNVFSDKRNPPNVTINSGGSFNFTWSSIESVILTPGPGSQTVNLYGDNDDPLVDQPDNYVIVGADVDSTLAPIPGAQPPFQPDPDGDNEFYLQINGSAPIGFRNVATLNAYGDDSALTDSDEDVPTELGDNDTLELTPYADDTPQGWGIDVYFNEGKPAQSDGEQDDLIILHTSLFGGAVSEDIVIQPAGPESGEIVVTNGSFGTPIVDIDYVSNLDIIVLDDDGFANDTDTLTLRGTTASPTYGDDCVIADLTAAGTVGDPMVTVGEPHALDPTILTTMYYRLRDFQGFGTLNFEMLGGEDTISYTPGPIPVSFDGGDPPDVAAFRGDQLRVLVPHSATILQGAEAGTGLMYPGYELGPIDFTNFDRLSVDTEDSTSPDRNLFVTATSRDDTIAVQRIFASYVGMVLLDDGFKIVFNGSGGEGTFTGLSLNGAGGDDTFSIEPLIGMTIAADGGDPTASNTVIVNGTTGDDTIEYRPTAADAGTVQVNASGLVTLFSVESVHVNGLGGDDDQLTVTTPAGEDEITVTPGEAADSGTVRVSGLLPMTFENVPSSSYSLVLADELGGRSDFLRLEGTEASDYWLIRDDEILRSYAYRVFLQAQGVDQVLIDSLGGDDQFVVDAPVPFSSLALFGGSPSGSDSAALWGDGTPIEILSHEVQGGGLGYVTLDGIEQASLNAFSGDVTVYGSYLDDAMSYAPGAAGEGILHREGVDPKFNFYGLGTLTIDPQGGNDTVTVEGDGADNTIDVTRGATTTVSVDGSSVDVVAAETEALVIAAGLGDDTITVTGSGGPELTVDGGDPIGVIQSAGDALNVITGGSPFEYVHGPEDDEGSFLVVGSEAVSFDHIEEFLVDGVLYVLPDEFEPNDSIAEATVLGSLPKITLRGLTIHETEVGVTEEDYFQITAQDTGKLVINAFFDGDPGDRLGGNLDIEVLDEFGNPIAESTSSTDDELIVIPVVTQERYFLHVFSSDGDPNTYDLEIENFAAPVPSDVVLDPADDSGSSMLDNVTNVQTPTFFIQADLLDFENEFDLNPFPRPSGTIDSDGATGADVEVLIFGVNTGTAVTGSATRIGPVKWSFTSPFTLPDDLYEVSARVAITDGQGTPVTGFTQYSEPVEMIVDTTAPATPLSQFLASYSDSGVPGDGVTNVAQPAITGIAEANAIIRIYADDILVGVGLVGSDESDVSVGGSADNGLGIFEITLEPLVDGVYTIETEVEDLAGNVSPRSTVMELTIDGTPPQRPTIDLVTTDDTGSSDLDNVTIGDPDVLPTDQVADFRISAELGSTVVVKDGEVVVDTFVFDAAFDATDGVPGDGFGIRRIDFAANEVALSIPAEGPHPLSVESTDAASNFTQSEELLVEIDTTPPASPSTPELVASSDTFDNVPGLLGPVWSDTDDVTAINQPAFYGTGEANAVVRVFAWDTATLSGRLVGEGVVGSDESDLEPDDGLGIWEITVEPLADGNYDIYVGLEDLAGNVSLLSEPLSVTIDALSPERPTLDLPDVLDTGSSDLDNVTNTPDLVAIDVTAEPGSRVLVKDGEDVIDDFIMAGTTMTRPLTLAEGTHLLSAEAFDQPGNRSAQSEELVVTIDRTRPDTPDAADLLASSDTFDDVAGLIGPQWSSTDDVTAINQPAFRGTGEANALVRVWASPAGGGLLLIGEGIVGSDESDVEPDDGLGIWEVTVEPLADGDYDVRVELEDLAGNLSFLSEELSVTIDTLPPQRPTLDLAAADDSGSSDLDNVTYRANDVPVTVTAEDGSRVLVKDGEDVIDDFIMAGTTMTRPLTLAEGTHLLSAEAFDQPGNRSAQSEELVVTIDRTRPDTPDAADLLASSDTFDDVAGLIGPQWSSTDDVTAINQPAFRGTGEANALVRVWASPAGGGLLLIGEGIVGSDESDVEPDDGLGIWEVTVEPLADGDYDVRVELEDLAGNLSFLSEELSVTIDTLPPQRPTLDLAAADDSGSSDLDNVTYRANDVPVTVTAEDGSRVLVKDGEDVIDDFVMAGTSTVRTLTLPEGTHLLSAEAFDQPGNRSAQSEELVLVIDRTPPSDGEITVDLAATSDTGIVGDNITSINQPAFVGTAEANAKVRVFADDGVHGPVLVGEGVVNTDDTYGEPGDGVGIWEVTVEPLANGFYAITVQVEDLAGNITDATDREFVLVDPFEPNDSIDQATVLGSLPKITLRDVKLHAFADLELLDRDFFQITAQDTGKLVINAFFENDRGDVNIFVWDGDGNFIAGSASDTADFEHLVIPVVGQQQYFLQVVLADDPVLGGEGDPDGLGNEYDLEIENFAAPVPRAPQLDPNDDSGLSNTDLVTFVDDARLFIVADLAEFAAEGVDVLTADQANAGVTPGAAVQVFANGAPIGFADPFFGSTLFEFTLDVTADLDPLVGEWSRAIEIGPDGAPVAADALGYFNMITAAVRIFDGQWGEEFPAPAQGRSQMSDPLSVQFDPNVPDASLATIALATYSDTGDLGDLTTRINQPALVGVAEANTRLRLYAQRFDDAGNPIGVPDLVGQTVVGSDTSDVGAAGDEAPYIGEGGAPDDGLGLWEITVEPLADGYYRLTLEIEDIAGNSSDQDDGPALDVVIDTLPPQRPTLDLVGPDVVDSLVLMTGGDPLDLMPGPVIGPINSDTGISTIDNVTRGFGLPAVGDPVNVQMRVSAEPGATVAIKDGEEVIAQFTMPDEDFVFVILTLDEDPHPLSAEAFDGAGNRSEQSEELLLIADTSPAESFPLSLSFDLLTASDTADPDQMVGTTYDKITKINQPAFTGVAEANAQIRIYANGELVGQTTVGSDQSDYLSGGLGQIGGAVDDGVGIFEVTVEPLADGAYDIDVEIEDLAGNVIRLVAPISNLPGPILIDTLPPQRPTIDLVDPDDTGSSDLDNVTIGDPDALPTDSVADFRISAEPGSWVQVKDGEVVIAAFVFNPAFDLTDGVLDGFGILRIDFIANQGFFGIPSEGPHPLSVESFDVAGNRSAQAEELLVTIDTTPPAAPSMPDLLADSDSGLLDSDNVTNVSAPAFHGTGEANAIVRLWAWNVTTGGGFELVGEGLVGSDESDLAPNNGVGIWEITIEPLDDGVYDVTAELEDLAGNVSLLSESLRVEIDTYQPNTPFLDLFENDDTGRHNDDNVTNVTLVRNPTFSMTTHDPNAAIHVFPQNFIYRIYDRLEQSAEVLLFDSLTHPNFGGLRAETLLSEMLSAALNDPAPGAPRLADGIHNLKLEVEDRAGNISEDFLLDVLVDTVIPPASFGDPADPDDGLMPDSDTGVSPPNPDTISDGVTFDTTPSFWGRAEADAIVRLYADVDGDGLLDLATDVFLGQDTAIPLDGDEAEPDGYWEIDSVVDLNDPDVFPLTDGLRTIFVTAEDVPGNVNAPGGAADVLRIFIDTQGPVIDDVFITGHGPEDAEPHDLFDVKHFDGTAHPTPLVHSLTIDFTDLPERVAPDFLYDALKQHVADQPGHYLLVGDANGVIPIREVIVTQFIAPDPARELINAAQATVELVFYEPLPDDRFTLTISDSIVDPAGNALDGENNAIEPQEPPLFPTGDGVPGGDFVARFTVDSRPEIGTWSGGSVYVDTNGNFRFDPQNPDFTNRDITYTLGFPSDDIFAGNFALLADDDVGPPSDPVVRADGFDKLAAYGQNDVGEYRWLVDVDNDGVPDVNSIEPTWFDGLGAPVAGNFDVGPYNPAGVGLLNDDDPSLLNGDEVGLFTGTSWLLDTDRDFLVSDETPIVSDLRGYPIVGDFDGDGFDDLATFLKGIFYFDLAADGLGGAIDAEIAFSFLAFSGVRERPVAADMNRDGIDDLGLWVPDRSGATPEEGAEWYFLISDVSLQKGGSVAPLDHPFEPVPFGDDLFAQFGDDYAAPIVGNFDPPVAGSGEPAPTTQTIEGTDGDDTFELVVDGPGLWTVTVNGVPVSVGAEVITVDLDGLGGDDTVLLTGSVGKDTVELWPGHGTLSGEGYTVNIADAESITVFGGGGADTAVLHDDPDGVDTLQADPSAAAISGEGYSNRVVSFADVRAYATPGHDDVVSLRDDPAGKDTYEAWPDQAKFTGNGFFIRATSFRFVHAFSTAGNEDMAVLHDDPNGVDTFKFWPEQAKLYGDGFFTRAKGFWQVHAFSSPDNDDVAVLYDDPNATDTFKFWPGEAKLYGDGFYNRAKAFRWVHAFSSPGNQDVAVLYDDPNGDETLKAWSEEAKLYGDGFFNRAKGFRWVHAYATGGNDVAHLYGSAAKDTLVATSVQTRISGPGYFSRAVSFDRVYAHGGDDQDVAILYDAVLESGITPAPAGVESILWLYEFEDLQQRNAGDDDSETEAVDELFTAYWL